MKNTIWRIRRLFWLTWLDVKERWWFEHIVRFYPKILVPFPKPPKQVCEMCGKPFTRMVASRDEGWMFFWECENNCGYGDCVEGWFPYKYGWANGDDLERAGIEVV